MEKHLKETYRLWWEYLRRSGKYKEVCHWFREAKQKSPLPNSLQDFITKFKDATGGKVSDDFVLFMQSYFTISQHKPHFNLSDYAKWVIDGMRADPGNIEGEDNYFTWAIQSGFPYETEMLMNYYFFADVFDGCFEDFWATRARAIVNCRKEKLESNVETLGELINMFFSAAEDMAKGALARDPTVKEYKDFLGRWIAGDMGHLYLVIHVPTFKIDTAKKQILRLVKERQKEKPYSEFEKTDFFEQNQFEYPTTGKVRIDELTRYLTTYDLRKENKKNREIAKITWPNFSPSDEKTKRMVQRDHKKARNIIENVEKGFFPGKYQND